MTAHPSQSQSAAMGQSQEQPLQSVLAGCGLAKLLWFAENPAQEQPLLAADADLTALNF